MNRRLAIVLVSSLLLKLSLLGVAAGIPPFADERQYLSAGLSIARTGVPAYANPLWDEAHYPPAYPYFMGASCLAFAGSFRTAVLVVQALMATATAWLLHAAARRLFDERTALLSAACWAFFPTAICYSQLFLSETLYALLGMGVVALLLPGEVPRKAGRVFVAGLVAGLAALTRSIFLPQSLLVAAWLFFYGERGPRRLRLPAIFLAGLACAVLPWSARNTLRYGRFLLIDTGAGNVLNLNWNMVDPWNQDIGLVGRHQQDREEAQRKGIVRRRRFVPDDPDDIVGRNQGEIRLALEWLMEHPALFARHTVIRAAEFVNPTSMLVFRLRQGDYGARSVLLTETLVLVVLASTVLVLWAGMVGMVFHARTEGRVLLALLFWSALAAGALLMSITRYRFPSMPLLVPFAIHFLSHGRELPSPRSSPVRWAGAIATSLSLGAVFLLYLPNNYR